MSFSRSIHLARKPLAADQEPLVCTPLVGATEEAIARELAVILPKRPDLLEWRVDFFSGIADSSRVVALGQMIQQQAGSIPLIFTRRSIREGGQPIPLTEEQVFELYAAVCGAGCVDLFDYELSIEARYFRQAVALAKATDCRLIASYHNFQATPDAATLVAQFVAMEHAGADVAKIAVMPKELRDVLTLLEATLTARHRISLPIISMSMGAYGSLSRLFGWLFGSSVSFAVGEQSSAPGQIPIEQLQTVVQILQHALKGQ
ncbi:MAG: type I 3-dehydroquinate dehydratase [Candidatus Competibacter denitrificans]